MAKYSYETLLDEIKPSLETISSLDFKEEAPTSLLLDIATSLQEIKGKEKPFWDSRDKILNSLAEKDEEGNVLKEKVQGSGAYNIKLSDENKEKFLERMDELRKTKVECKVSKIKKKDLDYIKGLKPEILKGILSILA